MSTSPNRSTASPTELAHLVDPILFPTPPTEADLVKALYNNDFRLEYIDSATIASNLHTLQFLKAHNSLSVGSVCNDAIEQGNLDLVSTLAGLYPDALNGKEGSARYLRGFILTEAAYLLDLAAVRRVLDEIFPKIGAPYVPHESFEGTVKPPGYDPANTGPTNVEKSDAVYAAMGNKNGPEVLKFLMEEVMEGVVPERVAKKMLAGDLEKSAWQPEQIRIIVSMMPLEAFVGKTVSTSVYATSCYPIAGESKEQNRMLMDKMKVLANAKEFFFEAWRHVMVSQPGKPAAADYAAAWLKDECLLLDPSATF
ncbi:hypothetical protein HDV05_005377 [Chytridiales sp. JEL 0842]|nr:hypothetical protein HDV05_005377 [Chytridiales sp. JEL 0842]